MRLGDDLRERGDFWGGEKVHLAPLCFRKGYAHARGTRQEPRFDTLIYLLAYGGLRWGEAAGLRRGRCHLLRSRIEIVESASEVGGSLYFGATKTYQNRTVVLPAFLREKLAAHLARHVDGAPKRSCSQTAPAGERGSSRALWFPYLRRARLHLRG